MTTLTIIGGLLFAILILSITSVNLLRRLRAVKAQLEGVTDARNRTAQFERDQRNGIVWAHPSVPRRDLAGSRYMHTYMVSCGTPGTYGGTRNMEPAQFGKWLSQMDEGERTGLYKLQDLQRRTCEKYVRELDVLQAAAQCRKAEARVSEAKEEADRVNHTLDCLLAKAQ